MLLFRFYSIAVILVLVFRVIRPGAALSRSVRIHEVNESPLCNSRATAMFSMITPTPCTVNEECVAESGSEGNSTLYGFCNYDQDDYLSFAYSDTKYALIEHYEGSKCEDLASTDIYRADGKCHNSLNYALQVVVASNGSVTIKSRSKTCDAGEWSNVLDPVPVEKINTGLCFAVETHTAKFYLIDGKHGASASESSSGSADAANATNLASTMSSSPAAFDVTSAALVLVTSVSAATAVV